MRLAYDVRDGTLTTDSNIKELTIIEVQRVTCFCTTRRFRTANLSTSVHTSNSMLEICASGGTKCARRYQKSAEKTRYLNIAKDRNSVGENL